MKKFTRAAALIAAFAITASAASAANIPYLTGPTGSNPAQFPADIPDINSTIQSVNSNITPASMGTFATFRNFLDNGAFAVQQRGTGVSTGGSTSGCTVGTYSADRWCVDTNVSSGAGRSQPITATPSPPVGFTSEIKVYRNSGALLQPVELIQEISTANSTNLAGQSVVFSADLQALAGLTAASNNIVVTVIYGTGTDEGLGTMTASPAITPAWTGIATAGTATFSTTTGWVRYQTSPIFIPSTATEVAVLIGFTPVGSSSGTTDGFAITGAQLEVSATAASAFEVHPYGMDLAQAQRYYFRINEINTAGAIQFGGGTALGTTTTCSISIPFPVTMRAAPTYTNALSATTFTVTSASQAATVLGTPFSATLGANGVNNASVNFTTTGMTAKDGCEITSTAAGSGTLSWTADF